MSNSPDSYRSNSESALNDASASQTRSRMWLVRHGETEWSAIGRHTGLTDLPLNEAGRRRAKELKSSLNCQRFALVLSSPLLRARETCQLAGYEEHAKLDLNLREWDYGEYEGRTTSVIRENRREWSIWFDGVLGGETIEQVAARAQAVIDRTLMAHGDVLVFAHGHILRILSCIWLGLPPQVGRYLALDPASVSTLGYEHETRVISQWNNCVPGCLSR